MRRMLRVNKIFGLLHVDLVGKIAIEVGSADVELAHLHSQNRSNEKKNSNRIMFDDGAKGFVVV